jgi:carbamoylphosphate synthase large subunit
VNVIFLEPSFPDNQKQFVRALHEVGATVIGIGERPKEWLDDEVRDWLTHYEQVPSIVDEPRLIEAVRWVQERLWVDRLEATIEAHVMAAARAREATGIPGTSVHTTYLCRDKPAMKEALRAAGIPCARSAAPRTGDDIRGFAADVGFPIILKPAAGAGAAGTERVDSANELDAAIARSGVEQGAEVAVEEFVEGHEGFYDTISIDGRIVMDFATHYYPNVLEAMRTRWISPQFVTTNRIDGSEYRELRGLGQRVVDTLGIGTSATHMEWFSGPKGLYFSEIGCRPPGVRAWDLYAAANDIDIYREWANAIVHGNVSRPPSRRFAAGIVALRPDQDGTIHGYEGIDEAQQRLGEWVIDTHLPPPGTPTQGVEAGYMANAWVRMRHPDYDTLRGLLDDVGRSVRVRAG